MRLTRKKIILTALGVVLIGLAFVFQWVLVIGFWVLTANTKFIVDTSRDYRQVPVPQLVTPSDFGRFKTGTLQFTQRGDYLVMQGLLNSTTLDEIKKIIPGRGIKGIIMTTVPGSLDDTTSLQVDQYIRAHGVDTILVDGSEVASGGVEFFMAGAKRYIYGNNFKVGIHAWRDGSKTAREYPKDDPVHEAYLKVYRTLDIDENFYWYTLEVAPFDGMYNMTREELVRFRVMQPENFLP